MSTATYTKQEAKRLVGMRLLDEGRRVNEVARAVGVAHSTVSGWKARLEQDGSDAVKEKPRSGRRPKLNSKQHDKLIRCLDEGPLRHGFKTDIWTLPRVQRLINQLFGVTYHVDYLGPLMRRLGYTPQKPATRARQQDQGRVQEFREKLWPEIRKRG